MLNRIQNTGYFPQQHLAAPVTPQQTNRSQAPSSQDFMSAMTQQSQQSANPMIGLMQQMLGLVSGVVQGLMSMMGSMLGGQAGMTGGAASAGLGGASVDPGFTLPGSETEETQENQEKKDTSSSGGLLGKLGSKLWDKAGDLFGSDGIFGNIFGSSKTDGILSSVSKGFGGVGKSIVSGIGSIFGF